MSGSDPVSLGQRKCTKATERALLVEAEGEDDLWIPRSVVHDDSEVYEQDHEGDLVVQRWWAEKNGHA